MRRFAVDSVTTSAEIAELNKDELTGPMFETTPVRFAACLYPTGEHLASSRGSITISALLMTASHKG